MAGVRRGGAGKAREAREDRTREDRSRGPSPSCARFDSPPILRPATQRRQVTARLDWQPLFEKRAQTGLERAVVIEPKRQPEIYLRSQATDSKVCQENRTQFTAFCFFIFCSIVKRAFFVWPAPLAPPSPPVPPHALRSLR